MHRAALFLVLVGCASVTRAPCEKVGDPDLVLSPEDVPYGDFEEGDPIWYGTPPQGGAPYTPMHALVSGLERPDEAATIELFGVDLDDEADLGTESYETRLLCANVGDLAGNWVIPSAHHRYYGWELDDLEGRYVELTLVVSDAYGHEVEASLVGSLSR